MAVWAGRIRCLQEKFLFIILQHIRISEVMQADGG